MEQQHLCGPHATLWLVLNPNAVADNLSWYLQQRSIKHVLHYMDNYIVIGPPS